AAAAAAVGVGGERLAEDLCSGVGGELAEDLRGGAGDELAEDLGDVGDELACGCCASLESPDRPLDVPLSVEMRGSFLAQVLSTEIALWDPVLGPWPEPSPRDPVVIAEASVIGDASV